jgi:hypothetical protein
MRLNSALFPVIFHPGKPVEFRFSGFPRSPIGGAETENGEFHTLESEAAP